MARTTTKKAKTVLKAAKTTDCETTCNTTATQKVVSDAAPAKTPKTRTNFTVRAEPGSKVFLAGSFNNWNPTAKEMTDKKGDGLFSATLCLEKGSHEYKYVINGTWCADPECTEWVQNSMGTLNSVKVIA